MSLQPQAISFIGGGLLRLLLSTCRYEVVSAEPFRDLWSARQPVVFILWHGRLLPATYHHRGQGLVALISQHRDGEYIARMVESWGYGTVRGSSTRGGMAALRQLVRQVAEGKSVVLTPDGPQGPREQLKPGALLVAQLSGAPIITVAAGSDRAWWFGRWDRFLVPKPFSRIRLAYGEPFYIPREAEEDKVSRYAERLQTELAGLMRTVDAPHS